MDDLRRRGLAVAKVISLSMRPAELLLEIELGDQEAIEIQLDPLLQASFS